MYAAMVYIGRMRVCKQKKTGSGGNVPFLPTGESLGAVVHTYRECSSFDVVSINKFTVFILIDP